MNKKTLAFLTRSLVDATGSNMWKGLIHRCKRDNVPFITFRGPVLNKGPGSIIYNLINDDTFSGVISWASSDVDQKTYDYYKRYNKTPLVCMTFKIDGHPLIISDCRTGLLELMNHLIEVHKFTKIAFIRGPETHVYAKERYESYLEGLSTHNITINENIISPCGGWSINDGAKAIDMWLQNGLKPGQDIEAIIAVGDNVAIGAQEQLIKKGYSVPHDIAVCGFNGTNDAAWSNPPITTVEMPFYGQGVKAYDIYKSIINNEEYPKEYRYNTRLILGESCGCSSISAKKAIFIKNKDGSSQTKKTGLFSKNYTDSNLDESDIVRILNSSIWQDQLKSKIATEVKENRYSKPEVIDFFNSYINRLVSSFITDCLDPQERPVFTHTVSKALNKFIAISSEFSVWQDIISIIRNHTLENIGGFTKYYNKAENLFQQTRILINEVDCRIQKQTKLLESRKESTLRQVSTDILACSDVNNLMNIIAKSLGKLEMTGCYVALYNDCKFTLQNPVIPEKSTLIFAVKKGERISLPENGLVFNTTEIIPDSINSSDEFALYTMESLHYQDQCLGYIIFESMVDTSVACSSLRDQISCSLYSALLLKQRNESRVVLEDTMHSMTSKADLVSNQSEQISNNITTISKSMDSVTTNIKDISSNINTVTETVESANHMINEANSAIEVLVESTEQITNAVHMINDIAEKTNVLALNAAIEAAHAGDAGRGFSVVAKEVKSLAAQTVSSTQAIQDLVERNNINTHQAEEVINSTNLAIKKIASLSDSIKSSISDQVTSSTSISTQLQSASTGAEQISSAITEIAQLGDKLKL